MNKERLTRIGRSVLFCASILMIATILCSLLSRINNDNNPFATSVYILAVALIARLTHGYVYGIISSMIGTVLVNWLFTRPFGEFTLSGTGYPLTFTVMLLVSIMISALTTQIKRQEQLRFDAEAEKMRANLLRAVSHDLRTPLTSILGASSVLMENSALAPAERDELVREIGKDARWLIRMTENILSVTRFSSGNVTLRKEAEVMEEIIGSAIVKFRKNYPEMELTVERPQEILLVPMDATLIEQVLINLMENAALHGGCATRIRITLTSEPDRMSVSLSDNGMGFPAHMLSQLFDGYASVPSESHADKRRSMGIGLSVCRSIIRAHGGDITGGNNKEGGSFICFWLPCEEDKHEY